MLLTVNLTHPRMLINGHRVQIPLRADTGRLRPMKMKTDGLKCEDDPAASLLPSDRRIQSAQTLPPSG